jgi:2',3'-cyclic-nucleotide 2'-phosphodiesterase / 3'-nucleotidase / 5'-nucleotidase
LKNKRIFPILLLFISILGISIFSYSFAQAESYETATFRILATSDLHGQTTSYDYETNLSTPNNGLSKIATLVEQNRKALGEDNTLLVDAGDFLYDYTTNYFYDHYNSELQPIMKAMSLMNYDIITLGNHEFDYPWEYLKLQLTESGLYGKVVVANTRWHDSGESVFVPSAIITKDVITSKGNKVPVRIGVVGSTTNSISTRRGDYVNLIDAQNNYNSIVAEANRLKSENAVDVVVVLLHGGIGSTTASAKSDNIGYALTKISSIDAIVTGHTHEIFPNSSNTKLVGNGINQQTGCINGVPVVATKSHAAILGTIDLSLSISSNGQISISKGSSKTTNVTAAVKENDVITSMFKPYQLKLKSGADNSAYPIANGILYHNYDSVVQDSNLFQLYNNAKIAYGLAYVAEYLPQYKALPVIAATRNLLDSNEPSLLMKDTLSSSKVSRLLSESSPTRPSGYTQLYLLTGKQLREWLEYSARIYATSGTVFKDTIKTYVKSNPELSILLNEDLTYRWNPQYVFDGISYQIDLTKKPRYTSEGTLINSSNKRITNLTYNGVTITESQQFVLVSDSGLPTLSSLPKEGLDSIKPVIDNATGKSITMAYIQSLSAFGPISLKADHNWSLSARKNYSFLLGIPKKTTGVVSGFSWNKGTVAETTSYSFLKGTLPTSSQTLNIVAVQGRKEISNEPVPIIISATSKNSITGMKFLPGKVSTSSSLWNTAGVIKGSSFTVTKNGIYTILVTDSKNTSSVAYTSVDRYQANRLPSPKPDKLTNRTTNYTGTAVPGSTIHVTIGAKSYTSTTTANGKFNIVITPPTAFDRISCYTEQSEKKSLTVTATVRKTGPNAVSLNTLKSGDTSVTGTTDVNTNVYALIWSTIYVGKGQTQAYRNSEFFNSGYKIEETNITYDIKTGTFQIQVPALKRDMKVFVFSYDRFGITSKSTMQLSY